jgi:hypothetical protein
LRKGQNHKFSYKEFEVNLLKDGLEQEDILKEVISYFDTEADLLMFIQKSGLKAEDFVPVWKCEYPL